MGARESGVSSLHVEQKTGQDSDLGPGRAFKGLSLVTPICPSRSHLLKSHHLPKYCLCLQTKYSVYEPVGNIPYWIVTALLRRVYGVIKDQWGLCLWGTETVAWIRGAELAYWDTSDYLTTQKESRGVLVTPSHPRGLRMVGKERKTGGWIHINLECGAVCLCVCVCVRAQVLMGEVPLYHTEQAPRLESALLMGAGYGGECRWVFWHVVNNGTMYAWWK